MSIDDPTTGAAQLAERILDEVSRPSQNWCTIAVLARELADLAASAAARAGAGSEPRRSRREDG